jgi:hypothetical protein
MAKKITAEERENYVRRQRSYDPVLTQENYRVDLLNYTNYHNKNTEPKTLRKWVLDYTQSLDPKTVATISKASDFELRTLGMLARAKMRGDYISEQHEVTLEQGIKDLIEKYKAEAKATVTTVVLEKKVDVSSKHIAEVNAAIDDYLQNDTPFSMKGFIASNNIPGSVAKSIGQSFVGLQEELKEAVQGDDEQLKEGYSHLGKVKLKRFYALVQQLILDCAQQVVTAKVRKPKAKKEKPASVLVNKLKYLKEFADLNLKSEKAESIVGADTLWLYDTESRKITVYVADQGQKLGVKGTTITGFSVADSGVKTLRKPETFLTGSLAKRTIMSSFKDLKTKASVPNGRTNERMIILKVFQ